jgi:site-specific DNA-methyltransferase (adenine-specific)
VDDHRVILGDCLVGMAKLPDKSVSHVITDPPYSEHVDGNSVRGNGHRPGGRKLVALGFAPIDSVQMVSFAEQFARLTKGWVAVFCAAEQISDWKLAFEVAGLEYVRACAWVKEYATPQMTGDRPAAGFEAIVLAHPAGRKQWNGGGKLGIYTCPTAYRSGDVVEHTTQKPLALMEALIRDFTDPGELVLDPFAGSGTTGVACKRLGRRFLGFERDAKYHAIAERRIANTREQLGLFAEGA